MLRALSEAGDLLSRALLFAAALVQLLWWMAALRLGSVAAPGDQWPWLATFVLLQAVAWLLAGDFVARRHAALGGLRRLVCVGTALGALGGSLLYFFTPAVGMPAAVVALMGTRILAAPSPSR